MYAFATSSASGTSFYAAVLARADRILALVRRIEEGPEAVVRAIHRAVSARRPRSRYVVTRNGRALLALCSLLPGAASDALARGLVGFTRRNLVPAPHPSPLPRLAPGERERT